ncbi:MAG TPA: discoidin domain-containing protein, partial [Verrucomicrobiae bacterium]
SSSTGGSDDPGNALDGNLVTRWSTGGSQAPGQWFQADMGSVNVFSKIVLNYINSANDYPRGYQVTVSNDGINWSSPIASGVGSSSTTTITFATQAARYIRITQTGSTSGTYWSIDEFNVFGTSPSTATPQLAFGATGGQMQLNWPMDHVGWRLEMQTNALNSGAAWVTVSNSATTNQLFMPINPTSTGAFFRLVYP